MSILSDEVITIAAIDATKLQAFQRSLHNYKWNQAGALKTLALIDYANNYSQAQTTKSVVVGDFVANKDVPILNAPDFTVITNYLTETFLGMAPGSDYFKDVLITFLENWITGNYDEQVAMKYATESRLAVDGTDYDIEDQLAAITKIVTYTEMT